MKILKFYSVSVFIFIALCPISTAFACNEEDVKKYPSGTEVNVLVNLDTFAQAGFPPDVIARVDKAILSTVDRWNSVGADIMLSFGGVTTATKPDSNQILIIGKTQHSDPTVRGSASPEIGSSTVTIFRTTSDGEINWTEWFLRIIVMHEVGHGIGLMHNDCQKDHSVMLSIQSRYAAPSLSDIKDLKNLYGIKRYAIETYRLENGDTWTPTWSNLREMGNVYTSHPFTVVSDGEKVGYRDRLLFYTDGDNRPAYLISDRSPDGTVSENFLESGYLFASSNSVAGTAGATDGRGEYMIAWVEQPADSAKRTLRIRHNKNDLNHRTWVNVDPPVLCCEDVEGTPALAHIHGDTWIVVFPASSSRLLAYMVTHDDGDHWETVIATTLPTGGEEVNRFAKYLLWEGKGIATASDSVDVEVRLQGSQIKIAFPKRTLEDEAPNLPESYRPMIAHAHIDGNELVVDGLTWRNDELAIGHVNIATNNSLYIQSYNSGYNGFLYRTTENVAAGGGWSQPGALAHTRRDPEITANTGLTPSDCANSDWVCMNEAQKANNLYLYQLEEKDTYGPNQASHSSATTIDRHPLSHQANANYKLILRPRDQWPPHGVCADIVVTNNGEETVNPWIIVMEGVTGKIYEFWNAEWVQHGSTVIAAPASYVSWPNSRSLAPGQQTNSWDFGFCSNDDGDPGDPIPEPLPSEAVRVDIYDNFPNGHCARVTVQNTTSERIAWEVDFNVAGELFNVWNMEILNESEKDENGWHTVTAKGIGWNSHLEPGEHTTDVGYCLWSGR